MVEWNEDVEFAHGALLIKLRIIMTDNHLNLITENKKWFIRTLLSQRTRYRNFDSQESPPAYKSHA